jgi:hypothetical protein
MYNALSFICYKETIVVEKPFDSILKGEELAVRERDGKIQ